MRLDVVDAFTDRPFRGNPAAVAVLDAFPADALMQDVAREMNLSETAFVVRRDDGDYDLRWFTPSMEVDLCGHATLAAAHLLGRPARFHTRGGVLSCGRLPSGEIAMDFPADRPDAADPTLDLSLPDLQWFGFGRWAAMALVEDGATVRSLDPDLGAIASLPARGLIVTAVGDRPGVDCVSRFFAPRSGIPEDPVTGSAHCLLASSGVPVSASTVSSVSRRRRVAARSGCSGTATA